jgi:hypothetical protein
LRPKTLIWLRGRNEVSPLISLVAGNLPWRGVGGPRAISENRPRGQQKSVALILCQLLLVDQRHTGVPAIDFLSTGRIVYCCLVMLIVYAAGSVSGFGSDAAMPLLGLVIPLKVLIPSWPLIGIAAGLAAS